MKKYLYLFYCIAFITGIPLCGRAQIINNFAGSGAYGYAGDGGPATVAKLDSPTSIAIDGSGNIYINDQWNNCVRKVNTAGIITTIAGTGAYGYAGDNGQATNATFKANWGVAADNAGNVYITDQSNFRVRKVAPSGIITTIAGTGTYGDSGDGIPATTAQIGSPLGIATDNAGNIYFADADHKCVRKINAAGIISTVAGNRNYGFSGDGGPATAATLSYIWGLATDNAGNLYICDGPNNRVRKVNTAGIINTIAGNGAAGYSGDNGAAVSASLYQPTGLFVTHTGDVLIADCNNNRVRKVTPAGVITTIAGVGIPGYNGAGIPATTARLYHPIGVLADGMDNVYISDLGNARVRIINTVLSFTGGDFQGLNVCQNSIPVSVNTLLAVRDIYVGITDTWSLLQAPANGVANVAYTATSNGSIVTPAGLTYMPAAGFTGTDSFKVKVSNVFSSDVITIYVSVDPFVSAGTITGPSSLCVGATITLTNNTPGGTWGSNGHTSIAPLILSSTVTGVRAGIDTITYIISNTCGTVFTSKEITVNALPDAGTVSGPTAVCRASVVTLIPSVAGGTWSSSSIKATVNSAGMVTAVMPGTATIIYTVVNDYCTNTVLHPLIIEIYPDAGTITGPLNMCVGAQIVLTNAVTSGIWSSSNSVLSVTNGTVSGLTVGTGDITYAVTNSCGTGTTVRSLTVNPMPDEPVITEVQGLLSVAKLYSTYQWYVNDTLIVGANNDTTSALQSGAYKVTVTNAAGCSNSAAALEHQDCVPADMHIYPNPTAAWLNIEWCKRVTVKLMADDGRAIMTGMHVNGINLSTLPNATYLLNVYDGAGNKLETKRITKMTQ